MISDDEKERVSCRICDKRFITHVALDNHAKVEHFDVFSVGDPVVWTSIITDHLQLKPKKTKYETPVCNVDTQTMHRTEKAALSSMTPGALTTFADADVNLIIFKADDDHTGPVKKRKRKKKPNKDQCSSYHCDIEVPHGTLKKHPQDPENAMKTTKNLRKNLSMTQLLCDQCGASFVNQSKLQTHIKRIHLGLKYNNKNIYCEVCWKKCTSKASLEYHQRTHTGEKPFSCTVCPKRFGYKNQLRIHGRSHTGERPYSCGACGKRFSQKPALIRHYRVHTGAKPYVCQFCEKTFSQSYSLKIHVNNVHLKLPPNKKKRNTQADE